MSESDENRNVNDKENDTPLSYVSERVVEKPHRLRKFIKKIVMTVPMAVIFGLVACVVFVYLKPQLEKHFYGENETTTQEDESTTPQPSTEDGTEKETEKIFTTDDLKKLYEQLSDITGEIKKSVVIIDAYDGEKELFEDVENEIISSGVILSYGSEINILTMYKNVFDMDVIQVTFNNGASAVGTLGSYDKITGMAVVKVNGDELSEETLETVEPVKISGDNVFPGTEPIIYIGNPFGVNTYESVGFVANQDTIVTGLDIAYKMVKTDIFMTSCNNGFLFNLDGQLAGIVTEGEQVVQAMSAADVKHIIDRLKNDQGITYMGIFGETITDEIRNIAGINMPDGVYVTKVEKDSPAYIAGIRKGDIITRIGATPIKDVMGIKTCLQNMSPGNKLNVVVSRQNNEEFDTYTLEVELRER